jgi:hypothetical protein
LSRVKKTIQVLAITSRGIFHIHVQVLYICVADQGQVCFDFVKAIFTSSPGSKMLCIIIPSCSLLSTMSSVLLSFFSSLNCNLWSFGDVMSRMSCQISSDNKKKHTLSLFYLIFTVIRQSRVTDPPDGAEVGHLSRVTLAFTSRDKVLGAENRPSHASATVTGHMSQAILDGTRWWPKVTCFGRVGKICTNQSQIRSVINTLQVFAIVFGGKQEDVPCTRAGRDVFTISAGSQGLTRARVIWVSILTYRAPRTTRYSLRKTL